MTEQQWEMLKQVVAGKVFTPLPVGFIIDSPWLPNWYGMRILDYFSNDELWFAANLKAANDFPDVLFLPGFWAEFGMCTEPSAFGARCSFPEKEFPHAHKVLASIADLEALPQPNPRTDGLLPFVLNRLKLAEPKLRGHGHCVYFSVARGPLNIAAHLMGTTEFLTTMMIEPEKTEQLLDKITSFLKDWLHLQRETFPTIDGIFLLDDIVGLIGEEEFRRFALPRFKELFAHDVAIRFFHNDAPCGVSAPYLAEMGVNLFNMGFDVSLCELQRLTGGKVTLLGNIPPRDVLANGTPQQVEVATAGLLNSLTDKARVIVSCGGGMPPGVKTENILALVRTVAARS
ncbi:MAG: uroporphyrinogen decarboxylase family protein [bacterium]|nr:uroporphyrinogen decarboxylase [candidate division KSB1 bacterium]MDH7560884.1 uroporphyrinogen decarboxylase family protein [bacterium]